MDEIYNSQKNRKSWLLWLVVIFVLFAAGYWFYWRPQHSENAKQDSAQNTTQSHGSGRRGGAGAPSSVVAANAEKGDMPIVLNALGTVTPLATVEIRPQVTGKITDIAFKEGQQVQKGDFLIEIDPAPYQAALTQAQGQLAHDQALYKQARLDLARDQVLIQAGGISQQVVDTQASLVQQYKGTAESSAAQVKNAKLNLDYCRITSPIQGRVGLRQVDLGNYVQSGQTNSLVVVTQLQPVTALFTLPEDNLIDIRKHLNNQEPLQVTAFDRTQTTQLATGELTSIDNQIDPATGTVKLRAQFDNKDETLFPNQFVNIQLLIDTLHDATLIPTSSVQRGAQGAFVYTVNQDSMVKVQLITVGPSSDERIAVTQGLVPGDKVVTEGSDKLKDGAKVTVAGDKKQDGNATGNNQPASPTNAPQNDSAQHAHHQKDAQ